MLSELLIMGTDRMRAKRCSWQEFCQPRVHRHPEGIGHAGDGEITAAMAPRATAPHLPPVLGLLSMRQSQDGQHGVC
jgi:hypothetical protein